MNWLIHLGPYLVLLAALPALADGGPVEIRKVEVFPAGGEVRVEITLSSAVTPAVETAQHPARLILKLPGTVADTQQKRIAVRQFGVRSIRYGLNQAVPPETHLVVDLDQGHTYKLSTDGMKIVLVVEAPLSASARHRTGPAAAATRPLLGSLGRRSDSGSGQPGNSSNQDSVLLTPPPSGPPIQFPAPPDNSQSTARATAAAPAAENVPPVTEATSSSGSDIEDNQSSANANVPPGSAQPPLPQEPKLSTDASPEAAASAREDANTSLPSSSGQSAAANQTQTAVVGGERETAEGTGQGRGLQPAAGTTDNPDFRTAFRVKYVAQDAAYLDGGRAAGLAEGMKLVVRDLPNSGGVAAAGADAGAAGDIAELEVLSVAETSAVTEIHTPKRPVKIGDLAYLSSTDQQALVAKNALSATRKYPAAVSFTENDTLDDEARTEVPKPPLPSVNRA
ncbi:MAG: AMIN domain-containing protein, partial [Terriglobales bacterium]